MFTRGCRHVYHIFTCGVQYLKKSYYLGQVVQRSEPRKLNKQTKQAQKPETKTAESRNRPEDEVTRHQEHEWA